MPRRFEVTHNQMSALTWSLIFGGLLGAAIGGTMIQGHATFGWCLVGAGALGVVTGLVLIWVRSRWPDDDSA